MRTPPSIIRLTVKKCRNKLTSLYYTIELEVANLDVSAVGIVTIEMVA